MSSWHGTYLSTRENLPLFIKVIFCQMRNNRVIMTTELRGKWSGISWHSTGRTTENHTNLSAHLENDNYHFN